MACWGRAGARGGSRNGQSRAFPGEFGACEMLAVFVTPLQPLNPSPDSRWNTYFKDNEVLLQIDKDVRCVTPGPAPLPRLAPPAVPAVEQAPLTAGVPCVSPGGCTLTWPSSSALPTTPACWCWTPRASSRRCGGEWSRPR